jgi:hypothetical protein
MPFQYVLTNLLVDVPEAVGAIFLDEEGEAVEWVSSEAGDPYHLKVEGAYQAIIKKHLAGSGIMNETGRLESYILQGRELVTLTELLPDGYYVVLVARRIGSLAVAQHHLRRAAQTIAGEL